MNMFNPAGTLNASSLKDALQQVYKYASILEDNQPSSAMLSGQPSMSDEKRDELIARAIMTQDGKIALAQTMANPIN